MRAAGFLLGMLIALGLLAAAVLREEVVVQPGPDPWSGGPSGEAEPAPERAQRSVADSPESSVAGGDPSAPGRGSAEAAPSDGGSTSNVATADDRPSAALLDTPAAGNAPEQTAPEPPAAENTTGQTPPEPEGPASVENTRRSGEEPTRDRDPPRSATAVAPSASAPSTDGPGEELGRSAEPARRATAEKTRSGDQENDAGTDTGARTPEVRSAQGGGQAPQRQWQQFWGPFNTRASAEGFAETVADQTELEIRAVASGSGTYMIAYPYRDDEQLRARARRIEDRTGLELERP